MSHRLVSGYLTALPRILGALALVLAGFLLQPPATGSAHAVLVKAEPAPFSTLRTPPSKVTVWTSEPLNPRFSSVQVFDAGQQRVDAGNTRVSSQDPPQMEVGLLTLKEGTYTVLWAANSQVDGHTVRGAYLFAVNLSGEAVFTGAAAPEGQAAASGTVGIWSGALAVQAAARWVELAAALLLVGGIQFRILVPRLLGARRRAIWDDALEASGVRRWAKLERTLLIALPSGAVVATFAVVANASGSWAGAASPTLLWGFMTSSPFGVATLLKVIASFITMAAGLSTPRRGIPTMATGLVFLALAAYTGHAAAVEPPLFIPVALDWVHLVAASAWVGGMAFAGMALLPEAEGKRRSSTAWKEFVERLDGFSPIAFISVGLLLATGVYNSATRLSSPGDLLATGFGRVLLVKVVIVAIMVALSYLNVFVTRPRLKATLEKEARGQRPMAQQMRRLLVWEPVVGIFVLVASTLLAVYPPPGLSRFGTREPASAPPALAPPVGLPRFSLAQRAGDLLLVLRVGPAEVGRNRVSATISSAADGRPVSGPVLVRFRSTYLDQEAGSQFITAEKQPDGSYAGEADISFKGQWKLEVIVRRQDKPDVTATFSFPAPAQDATALLARADKTMNGLTSLTLHEELNDGVGPIQARDIEFQAPDRTHFRDQRGFEVYLTGTNQFFKERGGKWQRGTGLGRLAYAWSDFGFGQDWEQPVIAGTETIDGQPHSIVTAFDSQAGIHYLLWIGRDDNLIRRWQHIGAGHFLDFRFSGFNSTTVSVADSELPR